MGDRLYTDKSVVDFEYTHCRRCGRILKSEESRKLGFGPSCFSKYVETKLKKKHLIRFGITDDTETAGTGK